MNMAHLDIQHGDVSDVPYLYLKLISMVEGSLEVKLPTKQSRAEAERRED